jgi:hypothetical protein
MTNDELITALGNSQQKLMSLTVQVRSLRDRAEKAEERADILEELVMDVAADLYEGVSASKIDQRIGDVMKKLEWNEDE